MVKRARYLVLAAMLAACRTPDYTSGVLLDEPTHDLLFEVRLTGKLPALMLVDLSAVRELPFVTLGMPMKDPAPSPDGMRIAFVSKSDGGADDIFVVNRDGSGLTQLTFDAARDDQPAWSPDGRRIAFRSFRAGEMGDIWVMNADGSNAVNLTPDPSPLATNDRDPAWSPDGTRIAYASSATSCTASEEEIDQDWHQALSCNSRVWLMAADGSEQRRLTAGTLYEGMPAWSPDGTAVAFSRAALGGHNMAIMSLVSAEARELTIPGGQGMAAWTPDGDLVFVHQFDATSDSAIYTVGPDLSGLRLLVVVEVPHGSLNPAFLRRG